MQIATTTTGRRVHMVWRNRPMCGPKSGSVDQIIGTLGDDGINSTIANLLAANVAPSRLCGHCFYAATRAAYKAAKAA